MEALFFALAMWPVLFMLGGATVYCMMAQRRAPAATQGVGFAWRYKAIRNVPNGNVGRAIRQSVKSGWQVEHIAYDPLLKRSQVTLAAYVAV